MSATMDRDTRLEPLTKLEPGLAFLEGLADMVNALASSPCLIPASALLPIGRELQRIHDEMTEAFDGAWRAASGKE